MNIIKNGDSMIKVLKEKLIPITEVKRILEDKSKNEELTTIEQTTLEYARKFSKIPSDKALKLIDELKKFDISEFSIIQIINILPETIEELRVILDREEKIFETETLKQILNVIMKYKSEEE